MQVTGMNRLRVEVLETDESPQVSLVSQSYFFPSNRIIATKAMFKETLGELVGRETPAVGGVATYLLVQQQDVEDSRQSSSAFSAIGVVINANHALCDGRLMKACLESMIERLSSPTGAHPPASGYTSRQQSLGDLQAALETLAIAPNPRFLPLKGKSCLDLKNLSQFLENDASPTAFTDTSNPPSYVREIASNVVQGCRRRLRASEATLTGLMMACWIQAITEVASESIVEAPPAVSISCLVDLRPHLAKDALLFTNAFGTVTVSGIGLHSESDDKSMARFLVELATSCSLDLQARIQRGEAVLQSLALCRGEFDALGPAGTIELSNHGMYETTATTCAVALEQRFDGYDGVSVSVVSESHTGILHLTANCGSMFRRSTLDRVMSRVVELWRIVASQAA